MVDRVQFNPSTLKASYNASNSKIQVFSTTAEATNCAICITRGYPTPYEVRVTLDEWELCSCFTSGGDWQPYGDIASGVNGTHVCEQTVNPCIYGGEYISSNGGLKKYNSGDGSCVGLDTDFTYPFVRILFRIENLGGSPDVASRIVMSKYNNILGDGWGAMSYLVFSNTGSTNCAGTNNGFTHQDTPCTVVTQLLTGGTAFVELFF